VVVIVVSIMLDRLLSLQLRKRPFFSVLKPPLLHHLPLFLQLLPPLVILLALVAALIALPVLPLLLNPPHLKSRILGVSFVLLMFVK
jgi:hypothetical protein